MSRWLALLCAVSVSALACSRLEGTTCDSQQVCLDGASPDGSGQGGSDQGGGGDSGAQVSNGDGGNAAEGSAAVDDAASDAARAPEAAHEDAASGSDASMQPDNGAPPPEAGPATDAGTSDAPTGSGPNLITNGDFSQGDIDWLVLLNFDAGIANYTVTNGALCVTTSTTAPITVGYPTDLSKAFSVVSGTMYTFSYTAWSSPSANQVGAKIGQAQTPFTQDIQATDTVGLTPQTFSHAFTATHADPVAGLVFIMQPPLGTTTTNQVCFANVSVTAM